jgi:signal transduction histidine kinase
LKYADQYSQSEFKIEIDDDCKTIPSDRTRFKIILNNLLSNAIKFQRKDSDKHVVKVKASKINDKIRIHIEDNGEGIRDEHRKKIFEMFYRATDNAPGSGLGLYIAKEAAEKMGGEIEVESTYGVGSKFTITLTENGHAYSVTDESS